MGFSFIPRTFSKSLSWLSSICPFKPTLHPFQPCSRPRELPCIIWLSSGFSQWGLPGGHQRQEEGGIWVFICLASSQMSLSLLHPSAKGHSSYQAVLFMGLLSLCSCNHPAVASHRLLHHLLWFLWTSASQSWLHMRIIWEGFKKFQSDAQAVLWTSAVNQKYDLNHICNPKFSSSHIIKSKKEQMK